MAMAKEYSQKEGIDYEETFSPVAIIKFIRILPAIATNLDYEIRQMDAKTASLNWYLEEEIYTEKPEAVTSKANLTRYVSLISLFTDLSRPPTGGIFILMKLLRLLT